MRISSLNSPGSTSPAAQPTERDPVHKVGSTQTGFKELNRQLDRYKGSNYCFRVFGGTIENPKLHKLGTFSKFGLLHGGNYFTFDKPVDVTPSDVIGLELKSGQEANYPLITVEVFNRAQYEKTFGKSSPAQEALRETQTSRSDVEGRFARPLAARAEETSPGTPAEPADLLKTAKELSPGSFLFNEREVCSTGPEAKSLWISGSRNGTALDANPQNLFKLNDTYEIINSSGETIGTYTVIESQNENVCFLSLGLDERFRIRFGHKGPNDRTALFTKAQNADRSFFQFVPFPDGGPFILKPVEKQLKLDTAQPIRDTNSDNELHELLGIAREQKPGGLVFRNNCVVSTGANAEILITRDQDIGYDGLRTLERSLCEHFSNIGLCDPLNLFTLDQVSSGKSVKTNTASAGNFKTIEPLHQWDGSFHLISEDGETGLTFQYDSKDPNRIVLLNRNDPKGKRCWGTAFEDEIFVLRPKPGHAEELNSAKTASPPPPAEPVDLLETARGLPPGSFLFNETQMVSTGQDAENITNSDQARFREGQVFSIKDSNRETIGQYRVDYLCTDSVGFTETDQRNQFFCSFDDPKENRFFRRDMSWVSIIQYKSSEFPNRGPFLLTPVTGNP